MCSASLIGLRVEVTFHWGFWVRAPFTSKYQESLPIPPPTTLIGALVEPLLTLGYIEGVKGELIVKEEVGDRKKKNLMSPIALFKDIIPSTSLYFKSKNVKGLRYEDINKYVTLHYHGIHREEPGKRRYAMEYRTGALHVGKVSFPSGEGTICYLINEGNAKKLMGMKWRDKVKSAAYNITRVGSKESIVNVERVDIIENVREIKIPSEIETKCYIPLKLIDQRSLEGAYYYIERFWIYGWSREEEATYEDFVIPGVRLPIYSDCIKVRLIDGKAYELCPKEVLCF
jgi:CRISPR-associated protein Cas5 subtype I-A